MSAVSRRALIGGLTAAGALVAAPSVASAATKPTPRGRVIAYVGSRTTAARDARGSGITGWQVEGGRPWKRLFTVEADDGTGRAALPPNPSFLAISADQRFLYAVHGDVSAVSAFALDQGTGEPRLLNTADTGHANPVHLTISPDDRWLVVANFAVPGDICSLPIRQDGSLGPVVARLAFAGEHGRVRELQNGSNPHQVVFDPARRFIYVPNRGLDLVHQVALAGNGSLRLVEEFRSRPGDGPRHIAFDAARRRAYVVNEVSCSVTSWAWEPSTGALTPTQALRSGSPTDLRDLTGAEIACAGDGSVFVSNRSGTGGRASAGPGPDSVSVFRPRRVGLETLETVSSDGQRPRFITLSTDERSLFATNELSDNIVGWRVSPGGFGRSYGVVAQTGSPVCVVFGSLG